MYAVPCLEGFIEKASEMVARDHGEIGTYRSVHFSGGLIGGTIITIAHPNMILS
jgi:hypothetical protein